MKRTGILLSAAIPALAGQDGLQWGRILNISVVGYLIVLIALLFIYMFMALLSRSIAYVYRRREEKNKADRSAGIRITDKKGDVPSLETVAAIMTAIARTFELQQEEEKAIMTIGRIVRPYSPWSSKLYSMRNMPWTTLKR